jgi:hypothetical protein
MKFLIPNGFATGDDFYAYLVDTFEQLHEEGGRMMNVGLHCRIVGRPGRARRSTGSSSTFAPGRTSGSRPEPRSRALARTSRSAGRRLDSPVEV